MQGSLLTRLWMMINVLRSRSQAEFMFLSPCSRSSDPIASRDSNIEKSTLSPFTCSGAAQGKQRTSTKALIITDILQIDMLQHRRKSKNKHFVLICLTYAGLTTDPDDLRNFLR